LVIDGAMVVAGSSNYTGPANNYNGENTFVLRSPYEDLRKNEGGPTDLAESAALPGYFRAVIHRIISHLSDPYSP
jgi:phosphatidylserine/phosphatidylglycerophosphate/cardiolipin synthase-like enzyme